MEETVTVYNYYGFSVVKGVNITHGTYATMDFIKRFNLSAMKEDKLEVPRSEIDQDGRYMPKAAKP